MKIQTAPTQSFSEHAPSLNQRLSMDTKGPINPPSHNKSYIHVIINAFSHFVVTVPIKSNNAKFAIKTLLHHWIIKFGPPIYLVTDRGSEYVNKEMTHFCTLMKRTEIFVHIYECSYKIHLKIGHSKSICMFMHIILNHFQNSMFLLMKLFFTQDPEYPLLSI